MGSYDEWYNKWKSNGGSTACIVRITNQCDQKCRHCAFRSGPNHIGQMSTKVCEEVNVWVPQSVLLNIMGGEVTILPNYPELLMAISRERDHIRLISNGYWANNPNKFFNTIRQIQKGTCHKVEVAVSQDRWHEKPSHAAISLLIDNDVGINHVKTDDIDVADIVPIGRAWDNQILPDNNIKRRCEVMSNMIITEDGMLCRCPFGYFPWKHFSETTWHDAQEYIWGWRSEKLNEGMNCHLCMETVQVSLDKDAGLGKSFIGEKVYVK